MSIEYPTRLEEPSVLSWELVEGAECSLLGVNRGIARPSYAWKEYCAQRFSDGPGPVFRVILQASAGHPATPLPSRLRPGFQIALGNTQRPPCSTPRTTTHGVLAANLSRRRRARFWNSCRALGARTGKDHSRSGRKGPWQQKGRERKGKGEMTRCPRSTRFARATRAAR